MTISERARTPASVIRSLGRLPSLNRPRERYELLRRRVLALRSHAEGLSADYTTRYRGDSRRWSEQARARLRRIRDAEFAAEDAFFLYLCTISPRGDRWRSGIAAHWVIEHVDYDTAVTRERLEAELVPAWGASRWHVERVRQAVDGPDADA
jgi:hypothetical protein